MPNRQRAAVAALLLAVAATAPASMPAEAAADCVPGSGSAGPLPASSVTATPLRTGFNFTEGPVWSAQSGSLMFSVLAAASGPQRVQDSSIWRFTPPDRWEPLVEHAGSNGLALRPDGSALVAASHAPQEVAAIDLATLTRSTLAGDYLGRHFNSPNDVTVAADGSVYFSDPNFQRGARADELNGRTGLFRVQDGAVTLLDDTIRNPNGVVLSPDGSTLYVGAWAENRIYRYPVQPDGSLGERSTFVTQSGPDGATVDCAGNLYWASSNDGLIHVYDPDGQQLGTISAGRSTTNAAFGGEDGRTLFITSGSGSDFGVYSVSLGLPGKPY